jgi:alkylation response protein AidB-like acyl-CoA dehydrogenase
VTIRPLYDMTGEHHFNEVFFEDVRVPANRRVGEENRGWYILAEHLDFERSGIERLVEMEHMFRSVMDLAKVQATAGRLDPAMRSKLAELKIEVEVGRLMCYRVAYLQSVGRVPNYEASMAKAYGTEWQQRTMRTAMELVGLEGGAATSGSLAAQVQKLYLASVSRTIAGGTSEIQRNIIATRGLGLPRS